MGSGEPRAEIIIIISVGVGVGRQPVRRYSDKQNLRPDSQHSLLPDFPIVLVSNRPYRATQARLTNV